MVQEAHFYLFHSFAVNSSYTCSLVTNVSLPEKNMKK